MSVTSKLLKRSTRRNKLKAYNNNEFNMVNVDGFLFHLLYFKAENLFYFVNKDSSPHVYYAN